MEKLEKALEKYVLKAQLYYKQENYNVNVECKNKITQKFNEIDGKMRVFNEALKKIEILERINIYNQRFNHIEEYLFKSFTQWKYKKSNKIHYIHTVINIYNMDLNTDKQQKNNINKLEKNFKRRRVVVKRIDDL